MKRRDFLKCLGSAAAAPMLLSGADGMTLATKRSDRDQPTGERKHWTNTIFRQVGDPDLVAALDTYALDAHCFVYDGAESSADIIAMPYFAAVIDRRLVGKGTWESYLAYREEIHDMSLCIVVDSRGEWPLPDLDLYPGIHALDPQLPGLASEAVALIKQHRRAYLNR